MKNNNLFQNKKNLTFIVLAIIFGLFLGIFTKVYLVKALDIGGNGEVKVESDLNLQDSHKIINLNTDSPSDNDAVSKSYVLGTALGGGSEHRIPKYNSLQQLEDSTIYDDGNVGIGTTDPGSYKFQVASNNGTNNVKIGDTLEVGGGLITSETATLMGGAEIYGDTIISLGKLGVKEFNPSFEIDVDGDVGATGTIFAGASQFGDNAEIVNDLIVGNGASATALTVDGKTKLLDDLDMDGSNISLNAGWLSGDGDDEGISINNAGDVGIGRATMTQELDIVGDINLEDTTSNDTGVIYKDGVRFIHNFRHPTGDSAVPLGLNTFVGKNSGNFTMGSTATEVYESSYNTAVGYRSLYSNTTGFQNTAVGYRSLHSNTTGYDNTAVGYTSLLDNTTGYHNTAVGHISLTNNTTGYHNTAVGHTSLLNNTTGNQNTALGYYSLANNTTGYYNTAVGYNAGRYVDGLTGNDTSDTSIYLGTDTKAGADGNSNEIVIGYDAVGQGSNTIMLGNSSITDLYCYDTSITSPSDRRVKENITDFDNSKLLDFVNELQPITYQRKNPADWEEKIKPSQYKDKVIKEKDENGKEIEKQVKADKKPKDIEDINAGLIAQDVEKAMKKAGIDYKLVTTSSNGMKALRYTDFIPALIGAIQEQQKQINELKAQISK